MRLKLCFLIALLIFTLCLATHAQQNSSQPENFPCNQEIKVTPNRTDEFKGNGNGWTEGTAQDGVLSLTYCRFFKSGETTINRLSVNELTKLPIELDTYRKYGEMNGLKVGIRNLPLGYTIYKDMAFEIRTNAVPYYTYLTLKVPSIKSEEEFKKLRILVLKEDPLMGGVFQWELLDSELTIPQANFKTRTLSSTFDYTLTLNKSTPIGGRIIIASFDEVEYNKSSIDLGISSVVGAQYAKVGEIFSYEVTINNGGANPRQATEVVFHSIFGHSNFLPVSVSSSQGGCRIGQLRSDNSIVCDLGTIDTGKKVIVKFTVKAEDSSMLDLGEMYFRAINIVRAREKDYIPENNIFESHSTVIRR